VRGSRLLVALLWLVGSVGAALAQPPPASLAVGDLAPAFSLPGSDGRSYSLADYTGVRPVVLAWFPKGPIRE
jgi:peroxiredoxin Q/BCP